MWHSVLSSFSHLRHGALTLIDQVLFPPHCLACHVPMDAAHSVCTTCTHSMHMISEPLCHHCGVPLPYAHHESELCVDCLTATPPYDWARGVWVYDDRSAHLISQLKFSDRTHLASYMGNLMRLRTTEMITPQTWVVPVPLHRSRLRQRRYNQSLLLAHYVAKHNGILIPDALMRIRNTQPQTTLDYHDRQSNVVGCFNVPKRHQANIKGARIMLVDDVRTTGATLHACTETLRYHGAAWVGVITAAIRIRSETLDDL
ncbi:MAG: ComF family protein [Alphaproteobacteria bacterium]|nr:MAG: ComF family protein [Alphaproteobacteria bacterium]